jgi:hypothetical protein
MYNLDVDPRIFYHARSLLVPNWRPECKFGRFGYEEEGLCGD